MASRPRAGSPAKAHNSRGQSPQGPSGVSAQAWQEALELRPMISLDIDFLFDSSIESTQTFSAGRVRCVQPSRGSPLMGNVAKGASVPGRSPCLDERGDSSLLCPSELFPAE